MTDSSDIMSLRGFPSCVVAIHKPSHDGLTCQLTSKAKFPVADIKNQNDCGKQHAEKRGGPKLRPLQRYVSEINTMPYMRIANAMPAKA